MVTKIEKFKKLVARSTFLDQTHFTEDLAFVHLQKVRTILDKPIYVGFTTLELSTWLMYVIQQCWSDMGIGPLHYIWTKNSLCYSFQSEDNFQEMPTHLYDFDTSEFPKEKLWVIFIFVKKGRNIVLWPLAQLNTFKSSKNFLLFFILYVYFVNIYDLIIVTIVHYSF